MCSSHACGHGVVADVGELVDEVDGVVAEPAGDRAAQFQVSPEQPAVADNAGDAHLDPAGFAGRVG